MVNRSASSTLVAVLLAVGLSDSLSAGAIEIARGRHFVVNCHLDDRSIAEEALKTAEAVWAPVAEWYGIEAAAPARPMDIHLYANIADYHAADARYNRGQFRANLAFSHVEDRSAHIALQPTCHARVLKRIGLPELTRVQIAHEAVHLATYAMLPRSHLQPEWLAEGFASMVADDVLRHNAWRQPDESCSYRSTRLERVRRLAASNELPSIRSILSGAYREEDLHTRYALFARFMEFLATDPHRPALRAILRDAGRMQRGPRRARRRASTASHLARSCIQHLGTEDALPHLDHQFRAFALEVRPIWFEAARSLDMRAGQSVQIAFADASAMAWNRAAGAGDWTLSGTAEILDNGGERQQLNVLLAHQPTLGHLAVQFIAGRGVSVVQYLKPEDRWRPIVSAANRSITLDRPFQFAILLKGSLLEVTIDDQRAVAAHVSTIDMTGPWGLGAGPGSAGIWKDIRFLPAAPPDRTDAAE